MEDRKQAYKTKLMRSLSKDPKELSKSIAQLAVDILNEDFNSLSTYQKNIKVVQGVSSIVASMNKELFWNKIQAAEIEHKQQLQITEEAVNIFKNRFSMNLEEAHFFM